jgi:EpsI family protein
MSARRWRVLAAVMALFLLTGLVLTREHETPERATFEHFPVQVAGYESRRVPVSNAALRMLDLTDYVSRNYMRDGREINLYVGYHGRQQQGSVIHSPSHCLPANGWFIESREAVPMPGRPDGALVNRMVVGYGDDRQLVYYWYQGRGRVVDDEYEQVLWRAADVALRNRSDGALVRFGTGGDDAEADRALREFIEEVAPLLDPYIPA